MKDVALGISSSNKSLGGGAIEVHKVTITTTAEIYVVARQYLTALTDHPNKLSFSSQPFLFVEANEARDHSIDGMVSTHLDLNQHVVRVQRLVKERTYVLSWMENGTPLSNDDVSGNHILIWMEIAQPVVPDNAIPDSPENFLTPKRLPGEPPWLRTVPPARLVAVRIAPKNKAKIRKIHWQQEQE